MFRELKQLWDTFTCVGRLICPEGHVSSLNESNPIQGASIGLLKPKRSLGFSIFHGMSLHCTQNRYQCYSLWLRITLQVYNCSLFRSSSWFAVEKSRSHRHGRISFIVYPFPLWSRTKPPKRLSVVVGLSLFFSMTTNWLPPKVVQQWSQLNGMTDESWLGSTSRQHVAVCLDCHESYRPGHCQKWPQQKGTNRNIGARNLP